MQQKRETQIPKCRIRRQGCTNYEESTTFFDVDEAFIIGDQLTWTVWHMKRLTNDPLHLRVLIPRRIRLPVYATLGCEFN